MSDSARTPEDVRLGQWQKRRWTGHTCPKPVATIDRVGQQWKCPECGSLHRVELAHGRFVTRPRTRFRRARHEYRDYPKWRRMSWPKDVNEWVEVQ